MTTALALPPLATRLPDAEPNPEQEGDWWQFMETPNGHDDCADHADHGRVLALYLAAGTPFTVQRLPGATDEQIAESLRDLMF